MESGNNWDHTLPQAHATRTLRRIKEQKARERTKDQQLITRLLDGQLNPQDGNAQGQTVMFSTLHNWRQGSRLHTEFEDDEDT